MCHRKPLNRENSAPGRLLRWRVIKSNKSLSISQSLNFIPAKLNNKSCRGTLPDAINFAIIRMSNSIFVRMKIMRILLLGGLAAISLSACATTKREEVRNDIKQLEEKQQDLVAAERDGSVKDVRDARKDVREASRDLRNNQRELYRPGAEGVAIVALVTGQSDPGNLSPVPQEYRSQYPDGEGSYYRFDGQNIYRINSSDRIVTGVYPANR